jgi:hypothetical protein
MPSFRSITVLRLVLAAACCLALMLCLAPLASAHEGHEHHALTLPSGRVVQSNDHYAPTSSAGTAGQPAVAGYVIGGPRWRKSRISYWDMTRGQVHLGVVKAIAEWNTRGLPVRFVKARSRATADFTISSDKNINPGGLATVGYWGRASYWVKINMPGYAWTDVAWVASHELGHIYGLGHSRGCAVMSYAAYDVCKWPYKMGQPWNWRCRLQEKDDLLGIKRLYGGSFILRANPFCLKNLASGAVTGVIATANPNETTMAHLTWNAAARAKKYAIYRGPVGGACVTNPLNISAQMSYDSALAFDDTVSNYEPPVPGVYCYSVFSVNIDGYVNPKSIQTATITYTLPTPPAPVNVTATATRDQWDDTAWNVQLTGMPGSQSGTVLFKRGCDDNKAEASYLYNGQGSDYLSGSEGAAAGQQVCYRFWNTSSYGGQTLYSTPVDALVTLS